MVIFQFCCDKEHPSNSQIYMNMDLDTIDRDFPDQVALEGSHCSNRGQREHLGGRNLCFHETGTISMSDPQYYYVDKSNQQAGPLPLPELKKLYENEV